ncbi:hypothetical protein [Rugosimonospora africana]|nr:hypothetical protein [Rugosimonospora africana]
MTPLDLADLTPSQLDADIRAAAAEVFARVQAWHDSPAWCGGQDDRRGYADVVLAIIDIDEVPEPVDYAGLWRLTRAVAPILNHSWPDDPGPARDLATAVEALRRTTVTRLREAEQARRRGGRR